MHDNRIFFTVEQIKSFNLNFDNGEKIMNEPIPRIDEIEKKNIFVSTNQISKVI